MADAVDIVTRYASAKGEGDDFLADFEASPGSEPTLASRLKSVSKAVGGSSGKGH